MSKNPPSLYDICISNAVANCIRVCKCCKKKFRCLPDNVLFDFYYKMFLENRLCQLAIEFSNLKVFNRMVCVRHQRTKLLRSFQDLVDHQTKIREKLVHNYAKYVTVSDLNDSKIDIGLRIGGFFNEAGYYHYSIKLLNITEEICKKQRPGVLRLKKLLNCYHRRIYAEAMYCEFKAAEATFISAQDTIKELEKLDALPNLAGLYTNFSLMYFIRNEYDEAFSWSKKALQLLTEDLPSRIIVEVLRQSSKACVVKGRFNQAELLIHQAVNLSSNLFMQDNHPHFSDTLLDYGFCILNFDSRLEKINVHRKALGIRKKIFKKNNIHVALGYARMAYALYTYEYSSSETYYGAREYAEHSIRIMERILPKDHLMFASVKRIKALILEEIALRYNRELREEYFSEAEQLHKEALSLSYQAFGEKNLQTARHYGNLGTLYASMKQYKEAEEVLLRTIAITEKLLGKDDYEVGFNISHLAALYNYHMKRHKDAEKLYMRSIEIYLNWFGEAYSGLGHDYRGLINVYTKLLDADMVNHYTNKMRQWRSLRVEVIKQIVVHKGELQPIRNIVDKFLNMCE